MEIAYRSGEEAQRVNVRLFVCTCVCCVFGVEVCVGEWEGEEGGVDV